MPSRAGMEWSPSRRSNSTSWEILPAPTLRPCSKPMYVRSGSSFVGRSAWTADLAVAKRGGTRLQLASHLIGTALTLQDVSARFDNAYSVVACTHRYDMRRDQDMADTRMTRPDEWITIAVIALFAVLTFLPAEFVHLHVHSHFSLLDGCTSPRALSMAAARHPGSRT